MSYILKSIHICQNLGNVFQISVLQKLHEIRLNKTENTKSQASKGTRLNGQASKRKRINSKRIFNF